MSRYTFKLVMLFLIPAASFCQADKSDSVLFRKYGPRFSFDVFRVILDKVPGLDTARTGFEVTADFEISKAYYLVAEYGQQKLDFSTNLFDYASEGYFFRAGIDYNFLQKKLPLNQYEMFFGGIRYCFSSYSHAAGNILIRDNLFGVPEPIDVGPIDLWASWIEVTGGIRGEIFRNFFIGWTFRGRLMLFQKKDEVMAPYFIPGFGSGNKRTSIGFNYYVSYKIPLYKKKFEIVHE